MKISIPIGGSCWFVQLDNDFVMPVTSYLKANNINYTESYFTQPDIIVDTIASALDFVDMTKTAISKINKSMEA